ncbi:hypothetical protein M405DRAFT_805902 [Rhizopogon salebrosus TDB-379]|nr:hypothetical protein M405DRAFT_805902 [Rhizopogon salebrosus TDB-379]
MVQGTKPFMPVKLMLDSNVPRDFQGDRVLVVCHPVGCGPPRWIDPPESGNWFQGGF